MSRQDLEKPAVHVFIFSWLNCYEGVFAGLSKKMLRQLQRIQNSAALILKQKGVDHIAPVLRSLHCLPVRQRVAFKILPQIYKALAGLGPKYISDLRPHRDDLSSSGTGSVGFQSQSVQFLYSTYLERTPTEPFIKPNNDTFLTLHRNIHYLFIYSIYLFIPLNLISI